MEKNKHKKSSELHLFEQKQPGTANRWVWYSVLFYLFFSWLQYVDITIFCAFFPFPSTCL